MLATDEHEDAAEEKPPTFDFFGLCGKTLIPTLQATREHHASFGVFELHTTTTTTTHDSCEDALTSLVHDNTLPSTSRLPWMALRSSAAWSHGACGVCKMPPRWRMTNEDQLELHKQLQVAAFLGLGAVVLPLPSTSASPRNDESHTLEDEEHEERCFAAQLTSWLHPHLVDGITKVWVQCEAHSERHWRCFHHLRRAMLRSFSATTTSSSSTCVNEMVAPPTLKMVLEEDVHRRALSIVQPMLLFSSTHEANAVEWRWLGEEVAAFEWPNTATTTTNDDDDDDDDDVDVSALAGLLSHTDGRWATRYALDHPPSRDVLLVELLRRRAAPVFCVQHLRQHYRHAQAYFHVGVATDVARQAFMGCEDTLLQPLQPLADQLNSTTYEVFERDAAKYDHYRQAIFLFMQDWLTTGEHHVARQRRHEGEGVGADGADVKDGNDDDVLHIMIPGVGRGPLIHECFAAAADLGVRLRLIALDKNPSAVAYTRLRMLHDREWRHMIHVFGHEVDVLEMDARHLQDELLPQDFGLCDAIISELLGSIGCNELSPECLDGFLDELQRVQATRGIVANDSMVCIPTSYTAWIAPLHSTRIERTLMELAVRGVGHRSQYDSCAPHSWTPREASHAAAYESMYVCNLTSGVLLDDPQPCWTFTHMHASTTSSAKRHAEHTRRADLVFQLPRHGRCGALAGFFTAELYRAVGPLPREASARVVAISIAPTQRTPMMSSWFPCIFGLQPDVVVDGNQSSGAQNTSTYPLHVRVQRQTDAEASCVWYTWGVRHGDDDGDVRMMNEHHWASRVCL